MEIYIAVFAGSLSTLLLAALYVADRYEPEPVELIQNVFLAGVLGQLGMIFAVVAAVGPVQWSGGWLVGTVVATAVAMPFLLAGRAEVDERFDGVVYTAAFAGGTTCVMHLYNLPRLVAASPFRRALEPGAEPDLRDLVILAGSPGFTAELGRGLVVISIAILVGAVVGVLQLRGTQPWKTAAAAAATAAVLGAVDLSTGQHPVSRIVLVSGAVAAAALLVRRSIYRDRPEPREADVLLSGLKTVLVIFGSALLATVLLQAVIEQPESLQGVSPPEGTVGQPSTGASVP